MTQREAKRVAYRMAASILEHADAGVLGCPEGADDDADQARLDRAWAEIVDHLYWLGGCERKAREGETP